MRTELNRIRIRARERVRFCVLADLHGERAPEAVRLVREAQPELILCPGDLFEWSYEGPDGVPGKTDLLHRLVRLVDRVLGPERCRKGPERDRNTAEFLRELGGIAPVYCSEGNHDRALTEERRKAFSDTGAILLGEEPVRMELPGGVVSLAGVSHAGERARALRLGQMPGFRILLCHWPELFHPVADGCGADLTVSGHAHGGQWRLFGRGLYAPGQGIFPRYTKGLYEGGLLVTAGLSNNSNLPRLNDPPEVLLVETGPEL